MNLIAILLVELCIKELIRTSRKDKSERFLFSSINAINFYLKYSVVTL